MEDKGMSGTNEYGIQSIPPHYDVNNSYYVYTSEGYSKAVEEIDTEERDIAEAELRADTQQRLDSEEIERLEDLNREVEKQILEGIHLKEKQVELQLVDLGEYEEKEEIPTGSNVNLLA